MQLRPLVVLAALALASPLVAAEWAEDVAAHFVEPHTREHVFEKAAGLETKPVMVIAMTTWCGACASLRNSVNTGTKVRPLLDKFVVGYATEEGLENVWTERGQDYVPQVYFFNSDGKQLHVYAENAQYKYFFSDEVSLETAMLKAVDLQAKGSIGEPPAGVASTTAPIPAADGAVTESPDPNAPTSPAPDPNVPIFDPELAMDESIKGHFVEGMKPEELRKKAVEDNRPFMVWLTTSWCHACKDLIESVNSGNHTKDLLHAFVNNHAFGDQGLRDWQPQGEDYVPQVLFFDVDGTLLEVPNKNTKYKHFFGDDEELGAAMALALDASKAAGEL